MTEFYSYVNPSPATLTKLDRVVDQAVSAVERIDQARSLRPRQQHEIIMLVQFTTKFIQQHRCTKSRAVNEAARIFCWDDNDIRKLLNEYLDGDEVLPRPKTVKKRLLACSCGCLVTWLAV